MKNHSLGYFCEKVHKRYPPFPFDAQVELTYRCSLDCIHCYCKGLEGKEEELTTNEFKRIFDEIHKQGCLWLALTGGEPLIREDFLEIYSYARRKGFVITIFTNGQLFNKKLINFLEKTPPYSIEVTLNGITKNTYERISQVEGSFSRVIENIKNLARNKLPLVIKTNFLKQNREEIVRIKKWVENILGKPSNKHYFKYDPIIYPRLNGSKAPCKHRLSFKEIAEVLKQDEDMWQQYQEGLHEDIPNLQRGCDYLYHCNSWLSQFFINPYGRLKFCLFSDKFSVNLKEASFKDGFNKVFPKILKEKFITDAKCRNCNLRPICYWCPTRAYLEMGNEEKPVEYYCQLAEATAEETKRLRAAGNT